MKTLILYSSATGNTKKLAQVIAQEVEDGELIAIKDVLPSMLQNFTMIYLGYWVDKGDLDALSAKLAPHLSTCKVVLFGTLGAAQNSDYYAMVKKRVESHFQEVELYGHFLCQGKVEEATIERYRHMLKEDPNNVHLQAQLDNYENGKTHPDEKDLQDARDFVRAFG